MRHVVREGIITAGLLGLAVLAALLLPQQQTPTGFVAFTRVNVSESLMTNCTTTVSTGTNLVSFYCIPKSISKDIVLAGFPNIQGVFAYENGATDPWHAYKPNLPAWVVIDFGNMSRERAYWLLLSQAGTFNYEGYVISGQTISLPQGWNLVGMVTDDSIPLSTLFASISGKYSVIMTYNNTAKTYMYYYPSGVGTTFNMSTPYIGYWINMTSSGTWSPP
ncbi:MAG: hypothetical protein ABIA93_05470 [Candidatus Woesearchaeota archaeon]